MQQYDIGTQEFFAELAEVVRPFRSNHDIPNANCNGCLFVMGKGKDAGKIRFGFMAKGDNIVTADIIARDILANPKEYIENMLEGINAGINQMANEVKIIVPGARSIH